MASADPKLYEARAIVLSNMGQHKQALEIYVFKLQDPDKAEEYAQHSIWYPFDVLTMSRYCNQIYAQETSQKAKAIASKHTTVNNGGESHEEHSSIYHDLLSLYLAPPPPRKPQWPPALAVLAKHGARIPASSTLALVPESLPVQELESYFRGRIRAANTVVNEDRVIANLRGALAFSEDSKLRLGDGRPGGNGGRNRRVVINEDRVCGVCFKRFGGSAVKVLPE